MMRRMILCLACAVLARAAAAAPFVCVVGAAARVVSSPGNDSPGSRLDARPRLGQLRAGPRRVGRSQDPGGEQGRGAAAVPRRGGRGDLFKSLRGRRPDSSDVRALVLDGDRGLVSGL